MEKAEEKENKGKKSYASFVATASILCLFALHKPQGLTSLAEALLRFERLAAVLCVLSVYAI